MPHGGKRDERKERSFDQQPRLLIEDHSTSSWSARRLSELRAKCVPSEAGLRTAITKVFPTRSHTVAAPGATPPAAAARQQYRQNNSAYCFMYRLRSRAPTGSATELDQIWSATHRRQCCNWSTGACRSRREDDGKIYQRRSAAADRHPFVGGGPAHLRLRCRPPATRLHLPQWPGAAPFRGRVLRRIFRHRPDHERLRAAASSSADQNLRHPAQSSLFRTDDHAGDRRLKLTYASCTGTQTGDGNAMVLRAGLRSRTWELLQFHRPASMAPSACPLKVPRRAPIWSMRKASASPAAAVSRAYLA